MSRLIVFKSLWGNLGKVGFHPIYHLIPMKLMVLVIAAAANGVVLISIASGQSIASTPSILIWTETSPTGSNQPVGDHFFRRKFSVVQPDEAELQFSWPGEAELFINGKSVFQGKSGAAAQNIDMLPHFKPGGNVIGIKIRALNQHDIGLDFRLRIRERGETRWRVLSSDSSWKGSTETTLRWQEADFNDTSWPRVRMISNSSSTAAGDTTLPSNRNSNVENKTKTSEENPIEDTRFSIAENFIVEEVMSPDETGSLIAMEINEFGKFLLSQENGPLLIADPSRPVGDASRLRTYCDQVKSCQGILALNGSVYVTGLGPQGMGLYLLTDTNRNGTIDGVKKILGFTGGLGEHGPHGIQLGPDGMIYVILGNATRVIESVADSSPYGHWYEGDLVPRYEDPGGHAVGIKAPGGTIIRMTVDGKKVERFAGGIRNAYDLVFNAWGDLFIHDSDMESDVGAPWYRSNNVYHVPAGAEMGWRSGWSNFAMHWLDQNPALCETGRGSPTGAVLYQHYLFPARYHDTIFLADWSEGEIRALIKEPRGAGYVAKTEVFLSGKPLNVCDMAVAEDGGLYFCTGGRGTSGGLFRAVWKGQIPEDVLTFESDLAKVIRHPQPHSAWARQSIAELKRNLGNEWEIALKGVAQEIRNPSRFRFRALQLLVLFGSESDDAFFSKLAQDADPMVRKQIATICGLIPSPNTFQLLSTLIGDKDPRVRLAAAEAYLRTDQHPELAALKPLLQSRDRVESMVGRRLLERIPSEQWEADWIQAEDRRLFFNASLALMSAEPTLPRAYQILATASQLMDGFISDADFVDLLRTIQIALAQGKVESEKVPGLIDRIGSEFPSGNPIVNQDLARLLGFLKIGNLEGRLNDFLKADSVDFNDRLHLALNAQFSREQLDSSARMAIIEILEQARTTEISAGVNLYVKRAIEEVSQTLTDEEIKLVLANGDRWPTATVAAFYKLPEKLGDTLITQIMALDQALQYRSDASSTQLRLGVIALMARDGSPNAMEYLRDLWVNESHRRNDIAIGLAQQPAEENWPYLVSSIPHLDDLTGREIVQVLTKVDRQPVGAEYFRDLIQLGYRMRGNGAPAAIKLLENWSERKTDTAVGFEWLVQLEDWQRWFQTEFPQEPTLEFETEKPAGRFTVSQLTAYLEKNGLGNHRQGQELFTTVQCAKCHRIGTIGNSVGPDLNSLAQRFSHREVIEAILLPSAFISDRYQSKIILTRSGDQHAGMAIEQPDGGYVLLRSDSIRIRIEKDDIEEMRDSDVSAMPTGLLDELSPQQVSDLMAFLMQPSGVIASDNQTETLQR